MTKLRYAGSNTDVYSSKINDNMEAGSWKPLTIITKSSTLDVAAVLDPSLNSYFYVDSIAEMLTARFDNNIIA